MAHDPFARARAQMIAQAERLVADLEASTEPAQRRLLPKAKRALSELKHPERVRRRTPASGEVLRHTAAEIRRQVQALDLGENNKEN